MDACHEIGVNVPIYLTGGVNNRIAEAHPEWRLITPQGVYGGWTASPLAPGFKTMCFCSPYLDYLCDMLREAVTLFPDADGVFIDIIHQEPCCCRYCLSGMMQAGYDPENPDDRFAFAEKTLLEYYRRATEAVRFRNPDMPVFHNSGTITPGRTDILPYFSHLELESLPTGGWGYDHFPMSASYCRKLDRDFLGMTGKFHTTWGEFGGFKHPNALRYECAAMLAFGSGCSVGDQLHPCGELDASTYRIIGEAYREVRELEAYCADAQNLADIAVIPAEVWRGADASGDTGCARLLLEGHFLFDFVVPDMDFSGYKLLILPDCIPVNDELFEKLQIFLHHGGALLLTGSSGIDCAFDLGATMDGPGEFDPTYVVPAPEFACDFCDSPQVMYDAGYRLKAGVGTSIGKVLEPYFNRTFAHFCSHQHAPNKLEHSGYDSGVIHGNIAYLAHRVFSVYAKYGTVALRQSVTKVIRRLLGDAITVTANLPSAARLTVTYQRNQNRIIMHLLYGNIIKRGGISGAPIEVIEELLPLPPTEITLNVPQTVKRVMLQPQNRELAFELQTRGIRVTVPAFECHQMVVCQLV